MSCKLYKLTHANNINTRYKTKTFRKTIKRKDIVKIHFEFQKLAP